MSEEEIFKKDMDQTQLPAGIERKRKKQFVKDIKVGDVVNDFFAVKRKSPPRPYKKGIWFDLVVGDKTGEIKAKFWGGTNKERLQKIFSSFKVGDVIFIQSGNAELYENDIQISISEDSGSIRKCLPEEYYLEDFIPSLGEAKIRELFVQLRREIDKVKNPYLKRLLLSFFNDPSFANKFAHTPSAISHHHNYIGGNLEHTLNVVKICEYIAELNPSLDKDLLIAGAALHDIGKVEQYECTSIIDKTEEGEFVGHIVLGDRMVREKIRELREEGMNFPRDLENQISHMIVSHHGRHEWGSPEIPKFVEALVLHYADLMDSQIKYHLQKVEEERRINEESWGLIWDKDLGRKKPFYLGKVDEERTP